LWVFLLLQVLLLSEIMKKNVLFFIFLCVFHLTVAQVVRHSPFYTTLKTSKQNTEKQAIHLPFPISSISIEIIDNQDFKNISLLVNGETVPLSKDIHSDLNISNLVVFDAPLSEFEVSNRTNAALMLHLLYAPPLPTQDKTWETRAYRTEEPCEKGNIVTGAQWRVGLPAPKEPPLATQVRHVIVHHAAGSNTATNYTEVVRNIFLLHTQTNGWNDIGYNFLIAQDGTVFDGRLGQGSLETDNVLGAHFCGKNGNTMGICLLGDYQTANPTQATLTSLYRLIAWKLKKENLTNVFASSMHPPSTSGATLLGVISGHRDGCNTDCPGNNVYRQLAQIKTEVAATCNVLASEETFFEEHLQIYPQPAIDEVFIHASHPFEQIAMHDLAGKEMLNVKFFAPQTSQKLNLKSLQSGVYVLRIAQKGKIVLKKLVVE
jgi:N-acetylmuramoyl-L-alanine amidase/Secretion system C-terminal sorting domain